MTTPRRTRFDRRAVATTVGCVVLASLVIAPAAHAGGAGNPPAHSHAPQRAGAGDPSAFTSAEAIEPKPGVYGTFADTYTLNTSSFTTPQTNPAIGVLTPMLDYFTPGSSWNDGTIVNAQVHAENIEVVEQLTRDRTAAEAAEAWIDDRRHQSYSMIAGLGDDAAGFASLTGAGTTITDVPADALSVSYSDAGNANGVWADRDSALGSAVQLVDTLRGPYASSNNAKFFYQYMRPFRWSEEVEVVPELVVRLVPEENAASDGGFPSGHTNAAFLAGLGLAASAPEHYDELLMTAAELGKSRIVAGMHSALDVIGGRILATGLAGATLEDPANAALIAQARADSRELLGLEHELDTDRDAYQAELARYRDLTTFGLSPVGASGEAAHVPEGAESLLRSRFPYLGDEQLRWVLYSTALDSGLPLTGDDEGWGRLDLYSAVHGYGTLDRDVEVTMDAAAGGTAAADVWLNDIDGAGGLTKRGTGSLTLAGENSFAGGVLVTGGDIVATLAESLGDGSIEVREGALRDAATETVDVAGSYAQGREATLRLTQETAAAPALRVAGTARYAGTLEVDLDALGGSADGVRVIEHARSNGRFSEVVVTGAAEGGTYTLDYRKDGVYLVAAKSRG
ncbi:MULTISPECIES: phosphatase PAP2 family protein [Microbacterium]|uniref:phosphatase PAP2 family protein n=1 Tax=Microbacterium TaxID=33882 RepID=UPI000D652C4A|nr:MULTISPECIES: phosphatase PAP2 family protein [Microbacterium]